MDADTEGLRRALPQQVLQICTRLADSGFRGWVVGGSVRDALGALARVQAPPVVVSECDWDIATTARPEEVKKLFRRVIPTGIRHGTVTVLLGTGRFEVTTLRGEGAYTDGRHPDDVHFVTDIEEDLARRDFTMNAIAYDPLSNALVDPYGGLDDLAASLLRAVGDPAQRFAEDGLRVLRAARFVATLEVELEQGTASAIAPSLDSYRKVSAERIREEWLKAMKARRPSRAFEVMRAQGMLAVTAPELLEAVGCEQNKHHAYDVWQHVLACVDACRTDPILRMAALLHDLGKPRSRAYSDKTDDYTFYEHERIGAELAGPLLERLRFSNDERERIVGLVRHHLVCYDPSWSDAAVRRWIRRVTPELLDDVLSLNRADVRAKGRDASEDLARIDALEQRVAEVLAQGAALSVRDLAIDGRTLMQGLELSPGPVVGELLRELLERVVESPELNQRETLLELSRALLRDRANGSRSPA